MINPIESPNPYKHKHGGVLVTSLCYKSDMSKYIGRMQPIDNLKVLPLAMVNPNPFLALERLRINFREINSHYVCVYGENAFSACLPIALLYKDSKPYAHKELYDQKYLFDSDYHKEMYNTRLFKLDRIQRSLLGSGNLLAVDDGTPKLSRGLISLDNGDYLYVYFWVWHNK